MAARSSVVLRKRIVATLSGLRTSLRFLLTAIVLFTAILALAGCSTSPRRGSTEVNCDIIDGKAFAGLFEQPTKELALYLEEAFTTTIQEASEPITTTNRVMQKSYYDWSGEAGTYQLYAFDRQPRYVYLTFGDKKSPALGRVIECLGEPTHYSMRYGSAGDAPPFVIGEFFFTDRGVIVNVQVWNAEINGTGNQQNPIRAVRASTPVDRMQWVEPNNDVETMDWLATLYEWLPDETSRLEFAQQRLDYYRTIRPWPGALDRLELTDVAPHEFPASTVDSPVQPTTAP